MIRACPITPIARSRDGYPGGAGPTFPFGIKGGYAAAVRFINALRLIQHAAMFGTPRTTAMHPASTSHTDLSDEALARAGLTPELSRLSVGLEDADDLIALVSCSAWGMCVLDQPIDAAVAFAQAHRLGNWNAIDCGRATLANACQNLEIFREHPKWGLLAGTYKRPRT